MPPIGRDANKTRAELAAGETGGRAVQAAQDTALQLGEAKQQRQSQAFHNLDVQRQQEKHHGEDLAEQSRSNRMRESIAQDEQDIVKADKGLESQGPSRADKLRQEMEQGRLQAQMDKPLEVNGAGRATIAQSPERQANDATKLQTEKANASARWMDSLRRYEKATATGDVEGAKALDQNLLNEAKDTAAEYNRFRNFKATPQEWETLAAAHANNPDPALKQEIQSRVMGPRLSEFMRSQVEHSVVKYIAGTGKLPGGGIVDMSSPVMQMLAQEAQNNANQYRKVDGLTGGALSEALMIRDLEARTTTVMKNAARLLYTRLGSGNGATVQPAGGGQQGGGMIAPQKPMRDQERASQSAQSAENERQLHEQERQSNERLRQPTSDPREAELRKQVDQRIRSDARGGGDAGTAAEQRRRRIEAYGLGGGGKR